MMQSARVAEVIERCADQGLSLGVDPGFVRTLYAAIIREACRLEDEIIEKAARASASSTP
jgi:chorismate mutase